MSANTSITEGGKPRPFGPVKALMVQGEDGKYYPWFPESDRALGTLSVDKNGIYRARDWGVYGWGRVYVNVPQNEGVTGRDPDTGEEVYVHPDPEGELVKDVLPVEIRVTTPPTKTIYTDGETIDISGMVVKAYSANDREMQLVPIVEVRINPNIAIFDESTVVEGKTIATSDATYFEIPLFYTCKISRQHYNSSSGRYWSDVTEYYSSIIALFYEEKKDVLVWACASKGSGAEYTVKDWRQYDDTGEIIGSVHENKYPLMYSYEHNGKTVYYNTHNFTQFMTLGLTLKNAEFYLTPYGYNFNSTDFNNVIWTMAYGEIITTPDGSLQNIGVQWPRPGDGAILETTFPITVTGDD